EGGLRDPRVDAPAAEPGRGAADRPPLCPQAADSWSQSALVPCERLLSEALGGGTGAGEGSLHEPPRRRTPPLARRCHGLRPRRGVPPGTVRPRGRRLRQVPRGARAAIRLLLPPGAGAGGRTLATVRGGHRRILPAPRRRGRALPADPGADHPEGEIVGPGGPALQRGPGRGPDRGEQPEQPGRQPPPGGPSLPAEGRRRLRRSPPGLLRRAFPGSPAGLGPRPLKRPPAERYI